MLRGSDYGLCYQQRRKKPFCCCCCFIFCCFPSAYIGSAHRAKWINEHNSCNHILIGIFSLFYAVLCPFEHPSTVDAIFVSEQILITEPICFCSRAIFLSFVRSLIFLFLFHCFGVCTSVCFECMRACETLFQVNAIVMALS